MKGLSGCQGTSQLAADVILTAFERYHSRFQAVTRRARSRFLQKDWPGMRTDAARRLALYREAVARCQDEIKRALGRHLKEKEIWTGMRAAYSRRIVQRADIELAETFFNSITRSIFTTVGVDPAIEFVDGEGLDFSAGHTGAGCRRYAGRVSPVAMFSRVIADLGLGAFFENLAEDARRVTFMVEDRLRSMGLSSEIEQVDVLGEPFFRDKTAYLVGRLTAGACRTPLVLALAHAEKGLRVDALLMDAEALSILFSYTRSYFHVTTGRPAELVEFLTTLMPQKKVADLYISLGYHKHGKTEIYRDIQCRLATCGQVFEFSPGQLGLVMAVINIPGDDLVFKLIKDRFDYPKKTTRRKIMAKYDLVFGHDRAGRLIDTQSFEHLKFDRCWFSDAMLETLTAIAGKTVRHEDGCVVISHAYVQRRVIPLDLYLKAADEHLARRIVVDYGLAIKDLAMSNIFPGDMLLKNFGVTRYKRVVFYDYDELCPLTACNFRRLPRASTYENDLEAEPWFHVEQNDVFPEEFKFFLGLPESLRHVFMSVHADLFEVDFWRRVQQRIRCGEWIHLPPYAPVHLIPRPARFMPHGSRRGKQALGTGY